MAGGAADNSARAIVAVLAALALASGWPAGADGATPAPESPGAVSDRPAAEKPPSYVGRQWALRAIKARRLQADRHRALAPVIVATIDSGVALRHPDLRGILWRNPRPTPAPTPGGLAPRGAHGWDLIDFDAQPEDVVGHGTAVAGLIAARPGHGGIDGVAPNARLMAMKTCWRPPGGQLTCTDASSAAAIDWAAARGARIIHLSWTLGGGPLVARSISSHPRVLFVTNSGNGAGSNLDSTKVNCTLPAPNLICAAASDRSGAPAPCTSVGPVSVDVAAPGIGLTTTALGGRYLLDSPCAVSFAGPHVSGLAALLFGAVPRARPLAVKAAILDGARPSPAFSGRTVSGGVIDVPRSLRLLRRRHGAVP